MNNIDNIEVADVSAQQKGKEFKYLNEIVGRYAYFPHADFHNLKIFKSIRKINQDGLLSTEINDRLLHYLLIYDAIIMHSSDPFRSKLIYDVLNKNSALIEEGAILFVFSNGVTDIKSDYENYIQRKISEYGTNPNSKLDLDSLDQKHMTAEFRQKTIELLEKCKFLLKKKEKGSNAFKSLIKLDLQKVEQISIAVDSINQSEIKLLSLSLWQLLNLTVKSAEKYSYVFPNEAIKEFIANWEESTDGGQYFSRHTITSELRDMIIKQLGGEENIKFPQKQLLYAVEIRLSLLYSKLNCMDLHHILEMNPHLEKFSSYSYSFMKLFLGKIAGKEVILNHNKVLNVRQTNEWEQFVQIFALSMSDLRMLANAMHASKRDYYMPRESLYLEVLDKIKIDSRFSGIRKILQGANT